MQHATCVDAIKKLRENAHSANVGKTRDDCVCQHAATPCNWVGNEVHYACLRGKEQEPQRVYNSMNFTKSSRITSPAKK